MKEVSNIKGRVIGKTQGFYNIKSNNVNYNLKLRGSLKKSNNKLNCVIGDIVEFDEAITKIYERKNLLLRPLLSNIDNVALVFSVTNPKFDFISFQKMLLWSNMQKIETILILNKIDLVSSQELEEFLKIFKEYKLDIKIFCISISKNIGLNELKNFINNKTIVLSGASGVGKSSLVNYFIGEATVGVGEISSKTKKGKNTTILTRYFENGDIHIFDTPGYSSIILPEFSENTEIAKNFPDFFEYINDCKFRNCIHINEPNCSLKEALNEGKISEKRYEFYKSIVERKQDEKY